MSFYDIGAAASQQVLGSSIQRICNLLDRDKDQVKIDTFCGVFDVSRSAAAIRLEQLGYLNRKKDYEYRDPLEVWP